ncbi:MAG: sigma-70 family RNA polymerase sigma factor [Burkholderiaceae bacterium]
MSDASPEVAGDGARASAHALSAASDEDLMLLVARGFVREPASELFRRHNRALFNFVAWLSGGDLREAEDVAQTAWIRVMTRCADYQPSAAFRTFLFQIARNAWLDARGSAWSTRRVDEPTAESGGRDEAGAGHSDMPEISPETELALRQDLERVRIAMLELPHAQREVVVLRFYAEMALEEIAHVVGVGFETVKSRLRYAYRALRITLATDR